MTLGHNVKASKEFLDSIRKVDREIQEKQESLDVMWASIKSIQSSHSDREMVIGGEKITFDDRMARYIDYSREIDESIDRLIDRKMLAIRTIEELEKEVSRTVLTARYINCKGWREVADAMHFEERWTKEKHTEALIEFAEIYCKRVHEKAF